MSDQPQTTPPARPALRIQAVDPMAFANEASAILKSAWRPPCLDHSPEYLRFQFSFPTTLEPVALGAFEADEAVGFIAGVGRSANIGELYLASFLGVRPGTASMLAVSLQRQHVRTIAQRLGKPLLAFGQIGSAGDHLLRRCDFSGVRRISLGEYRIHVAIPRPRDSGVRIQTVSPDEWAAEARNFESESLLSPDLDPENVRHLAGDPAGRQFLIALNDGKVVGVAIAAVTRRVTVNGIESVPTLHFVRLHNSSVAALKALISFAGGEEKSVVTVPNTVAIAPEAARSAELLPTRAAFAAYLFSAEDVPSSFRGTEFEIV